MSNFNRKFARNLARASGLPDGFYSASFQKKFQRKLEQLKKQYEQRLANRSAEDAINMTAEKQQEILNSVGLSVENSIEKGGSDSGLAEEEPLNGGEEV